MSPRSSTLFFGRWVLLGVLLVALAALLGHEVTTRRAYTASLEAMSTVSDDTLPTLLHLSELRRVVRDLDLELALRSDLRPSELLRGQVERSWPVIDAHLSAYLELPALSDEQPLRAHLVSAVSALRVAEQQLLGAPDEAVARRTLREQVIPATREVRALTDAIVTLNARVAGEAAQEVLHAHDRASDFSRFMLLILVLALASTGAVAYGALARAEAAARATVDELDAFAGRVAHDLRSPLQPATLSVEVLRREAGLSAAGVQALERLDRSCRRSAALIEGLLAFARAGARSEEGARTRIDDVALELEPAWQQLAAAEEAHVVVDVQPRLEVAASRTVVASVLDNLTRNALLYLGPSAERTVTVRAREARDMVELAVSDTGPGIPADLQDRMFRPFERGSDRPGGSGLGLATVKRLAEAHGGSVEVTSRIGEGSTFRVRLPRART